MLKAHTIGYAYAHKRVLDGVDVDLHAGEVVSLLGPNGTGKSTLLKILMGLLAPQEGHVTFEGDAIASMSPKLRARHIAYVPQLHTGVFGYSVIDVVLMGRIAQQGLLGRSSSQDLEMAHSALAKLDITHLSHRPYTALSGGERQMVLIARALAQGAKVVIMDEPVAGLDYGNQLRLLERIGQLAQEGYTFLQSTHYPEHAMMVSTRVIMLKEGKIYANGTPQEVITAQSIKALYGVDVVMHRYSDTLQLPIPRGFA